MAAAYPMASTNMLWQGDHLAEWFAIHVWTGREHLTAKQLQMRGYEVFLPVYQERRRWADRVKTVEKALFAGYVFCRMSGTVIGKILTTPGVIHIVSDGHHPLPIPAAEIAGIQRVVSAGVPLEPWTHLQVGDRVRIAFGPLEGTEGMVLRMKNRQRLVLSITALQRAVAVEVEADWLSAATPAPSHDPALGSARAGGVAIG
jgi:transcription antitermination factor NusG